MSNCCNENVAVATPICGGNTMAGLIIFVLIILQFQKRNGCKEECDPCKEKHNSCRKKRNSCEDDDDCYEEERNSCKKETNCCVEGGNNQLFDNSVLFILVVFIIACCGRVKLGC